MTVTSDDRLHAPATERNRAPIAEVLAPLLAAAPAGDVLEIASGTGEHVTYLASRFASRMFRPSDPDPRHRASIVAWTRHMGVANVLTPIALDASAADWPVAAPLAAILCINMIHISPWPATLGLLEGAAARLPAGGVLYLYGPYKRGGSHTAPSNAQFDASLRAQDPAWGVRDLETVIEEANARGLALAEVVPMPANNLSVVFRRAA